MSGHSKWANIKHRKEKSDTRKGKAFTKIGREIAVAVKEGGPDPQMNSKLADAVAKAKSNNMPNESIERSIKKATGDLNSMAYEHVAYEGYGPGGIAVIVETMTDNRNRTAGDVRHIFDKYGGNLGTTGCVSFLFDKKGVIIIEKNSSTDAEAMMMEAIEAGAEDMLEEDEIFEIITGPQDFAEVRKRMAMKFEMLSAEISMIPVSYVRLADQVNASLMEKLIDSLEDLDDVQNVHHNWDRDDN